MTLKMGAYPTKRHKGARRTAETPRGVRLAASAVLAAAAAMGKQRSRRWWRRGRWRRRCQCRRRRVRGRLSRQRAAAAEDAAITAVMAGARGRGCCWRLGSAGGKSVGGEEPHALAVSVLAGVGSRGRCSRPGAAAPAEVEGRRGRRLANAAGGGGWGGR